MKNRTATITLSEGRRQFTVTGRLSITRDDSCEDRLRRAVEIIAQLPKGTLYHGK